MEKDLLIEVFQAPVQILDEAREDNGNRMRIQAKCMEGDMINRNRRVYKMPIVEREVGRLQERIQNKTAFGSGDHPGDGRTNFDNVSHLWEKVWTKGREVLGEAVILNTDRGRNLQEVIRVAGTVPVSARGFGRVMPGEFEGAQADVVEESYQLVTFDFVLNAQGFEDAKVTAIKEEQREEEETMDLKTLKEKHPELVEAITQEVTGQVEDRLTKAFEEKILSKIAEEKEAIAEAVRDQVMGELRVGEMQEALEKIQEAVAPFAGSPAQNTKSEAHDEKTRQELDTLTQQLNKVGQGLKEQEEKNKELTAELAKAKVPAYVAEKVKTEEHAPLLIEALAECETVEQVDAQLPKEKERIAKLVGAGAVPAGKGKVGDDEKDKGELTEEQRRQQVLAGINS